MALGFALGLGDSMALGLKDLDLPLQCLLQLYPSLNPSGSPYGLIEALIAPPFGYLLITAVFLLESPSSSPF